MASKAGEIFESWRQQAVEYLQKPPDVTEQYAVRELTSFVSSKAFKFLEENFPAQAKRIKSAFAGKDWQSRVIIGGLSLLFKNKKFKEMTPPVVATVISDAMSEITRWISSAEKAETDGTLYPGLEEKLLLISPESLENYVNWQQTLDDNQLASVCTFLSTKSVEEIDALLQLDVDKRNKVMSAFLRLRQRPSTSATTGSSTEKPVTPLLAALRKMKGGLQVAHDQMVKSDVGAGQEGS